VITDDEVMGLLERANPASVDDPIPMLDVADYRDVLQTRTTTVTLIDSKPAPTEPTGRRRWPTVIAAAAVVLVVVGAFVVSGSRDARDSQRGDAPPVANGLIAFDGESPDTPSEREIYVIAPDGTGLRALTSTLGLDEYAPAWSPDGTRLAFIRVPGSTNLVNGGSRCGGCQLVVVDPSPGVETFSADLPSVSGDEGQPPAVSVVWSPDGKQIMVNDYNCGASGCGSPDHDAVDLERGTWTRIVPSSPNAEWSPDGKWLLLRPLEGGLVGDSLLIVPADLVGTGSVLNLDHDSLPGARRLPLHPEHWKKHDVSGWLPDSSAVVDSVEDLVVVDESEWNPRIDVIPIADGAQRRTVIEDGFDPVASPDSSRIAFLRGSPPDGSRVVAETWVAAADGSDPRRVTTSLTPTTWSPDGTLLLAKDEEGWFTVRPDGTGKTVLPANVQTEPVPAIEGSWAPSWQPLLSN
jgi:Tol biopolymer transport system component